MKATERESAELATLRGECEALRAMGLAAEKRHAEEVALLKARIVKLERELAGHGHRAPNHVQTGGTDEATVEDTAALMERLASAEDTEALLARFASEEDAEALLKRLASEEDAEALLKRLASGVPSLEPRTQKGVMLA